MSVSDPTSRPDSFDTPSLAIADDGLQLNITVWSLTGISAARLGLRVYAKLWRRRQLWWDDYVLLAGRVSAILAAAWTKSSFAITLLSISEGQTRKIVWFILVSVNVVLGINGTLQWIQCWPPEKLWDPSAPGTCWLGSQSSCAYNTFVAVYSGSMDIALALIRWKIIWHAKVRQQEKMGAQFAMSMGVFYLVNLFIFGTAEGAITIMAISIPVLRPLFHRLNCHESRV